MNTTKPTRRWYQYSLWNLFLLISILCLVPGGYVAYYRNRAWRQAASLRTIDQLVGAKGAIRYKDSPAPRSDAMQWLLGDDKYNRVFDVDFAPFEAKVTDADLAHLEYMNGLEYLELCGANITDRGVARLQRLVHLRDIDLSYTRITDRGLIWLHGMIELERLNLSDTEVGDAGMAHLAHLTQLKGLVLSHTRITDAGLVHLKSLTHLEFLYIDGTEVTSEAADQLDQLPGITVVRN